MGGHHSAAMLKDEWLTPPEILHALGEFDLDPCAPVVRPWEMATAHYTINDNGLLQPWRGRVWLKNLARGDNRVPADTRQFDIGAVDSNWDLGKLRVHGQTRPAETPEEEEDKPKKTAAKKPVAKAGKKK